VAAGKSSSLEKAGRDKAFSFCCDGKVGIEILYVRVCVLLLIEVVRVVVVAVEGVVIG
jgi:hypothetical protein